MTIEKTIRYAHGDYEMTLDERCVGFRSTYSQAEHALSDMVYEMLIHGDFATAEELDGGIPDSACAGFGCVDGCGDCITSMVVVQIAADPPIDIPDEYPNPSPGGPPPPEFLLEDCLNVITMALGHTSGASSVVSELRRVKARLESVALRSV